MKTRILLLGAPGAGKGSQAKLIKDHYHIPHISTGDMFREAIKEGSELGKLANTYISKGNLVPDEVTIGLVKERLSKNDCKNGYLLDGFPRTLVQAEALDKLSKDINQDLQLVIDVDVDDLILIDRITGRRVCKKCGSTYHIKNMPSKVEGVCDNCGGELYIRNDDNLTAFKTRLENYYKQTAPLIEYYKNKNLLVKVDGSKELNEVFSSIKKAIEE